MAMAPVAQTIAPPALQPKQAAPIIPFRRATIERVNILPSESVVTLGASMSTFDRTLEGNGFIYGVPLRVAITSSGNSATVALSEDAPWNFFDTIVYRDVNGELINLSGYGLYIASLINRQYAVRHPDQSSNATLFTALTTGSGATAGTGNFLLRVPVGINRRDLVSILGNQDRAQKFNLRLSIAAAATLYSTAPNGTLTYTIERMYENYSVPMPTAPNGQPQEYLPPTFGTLRFLTRSLSESLPLGGSSVNHYLRRLGNTWRWIALIFRVNSLRSGIETAANQPTNIRFKVGDDTIFDEPWWYRKQLMYERFGFDLPNGVLVYDAIHDFAGAAGFELGADYYHTQGLANAQFQISYPSGVGSTANSLEIITDDLQRVGAQQ